jgi:predicted nucleic acid-binding protein
LQACQIAGKYGFSLYDSLIVAAALESNCSVLYSEDLQDGQAIEGKLTVKNQFR